MLFARYWVGVLHLPREWLHITGIELDGRKAPHLLKWCDVVTIGDWIAVLCAPSSGYQAWDLIMGNPNFESLRPKWDSKNGARCPQWVIDGSMPAVLRSLAPVLLLLHTQQAWVKSVGGRGCWRAFTASHAWTLPGAVSFRSDGLADSRCYQVSLWTADALDGPTVTELLPEIDVTRWHTIPGTEHAEVAKFLGLPLAPGYEGET